MTIPPAVVFGLLFVAVRSRTTRTTCFAGWTVYEVDAASVRASPAAAAFAAGDLQKTVAESALARAIWTTARDVGRNRVIAVGASLAAVLLGGWLLLRSLRDRRERRRLRRHPMMARKV